jgi:hypothetical protein
MKRQLLTLLAMIPLTLQAQDIFENASSILSAYAGGIPYEIEQLDKKANLYPDTLIALTDRCYEQITQWRAKGLKDSATITLLSYNLEWTGTFGEIEATFCDKGKVRVKQYYEDSLGEHQKLMKNDKYEMIKKQYPSGYYVTGSMEVITDAKTLAKANVWFNAVIGESCAIDKNKYTYYRYQFDKEGKLKKTTEKTYCGDPGVKALK